MRVERRQTFDDYPLENSYSPRFHTNSNEQLDMFLEDPKTHPEDLIIFQ